MEKKKFIILLMSCNQPLYLNEEQACRDTFLKDAEGADIPFYFYRGGEEHQYIDTDHVMHLSCPDGLGGTSEKTVLAMTAALQLGGWDYLIKTNVSTWLNIEKITDMINGLEGKNDVNIYGARYLINTASKNVPFPRGHFSIFSRSMVEGIVKWSPKLIAAKNFPKTDDTLIGLSCLYQIMKVNGEQYLDRIMEVPAVNSWPEDGRIEDATEISDALCIRCKDEKTPENTVDNMRKVHGMMRAEMRPDRRHYRPAKWFETGFGIVDYKMYGTISAIYKAVRKYTANKDFKAENGTVKRTDSETKKNELKKKNELS